MKVLRPLYWAAILTLLAAVLVAALLAGIAFGPTQGVLHEERLSFWEARIVTLKALVGAMPGTAEDIVRRVRLPRVLLAALVGAGLAIAGGTFQAMLRNPLADPFILGVSGGASAGAVAAMVFRLDLHSATLPAVPVFAFGGALGAMMLVYYLARAGGRLQPYVLLMVGVVVNAILGAVILYLSTVATFAESHRVFYWLMGGVRELATFQQIGVVAVFVLLGSVALALKARDFNLLSFGEETSQQLGVNIERTKLVGFIGASLVVGAVVSMSGPIGFVGLIVPHLVRLLWGPDHRLLLPASLLAGGIFLVLSDTAARMLNVPVGVITAFCGGPFFLVLLKRQQRPAGG